MSFMGFIYFVFFSLVSVQLTSSSKRIVGGDETTIQQYPFAAVVLASNDLVVFRQQCGGSVLNSRSILTAAQCINPSVIQRFRVRLGSSSANSGGLVYNLQLAIIHPDYNVNAMFDSDIALVHTSTPIIYIPNLVAQGAIAGINYVVPDNAPVTAIGWGFTNSNGPPSERLRDVQVFKVNQTICNQRWWGLLTQNMMCAGLLDIGGQGQCDQDSGGPLLHNNVIIGVASFSDSFDCVSGVRPNVNTRVSRYTNWIQNNA